MKSPMEHSPIKLFAEWFAEAKQKSNGDPTAMTLATATSQGIPSVRVVLLKGFDERGFVFYTNMLSRKARELIVNPQAALCFYWPGLDKQVRIEGRVDLIDDEEADRYFASRSRESQIGAWASKQSQPLTEPEDLFERVQELTERFETNPIPRPPFWSGFCLMPARMEFWRQGPHRLHQRICYYKQIDGSWKYEFLYP
jgi:pyridoxamine 5'-phosphate oxidase